MTKKKLTKADVFKIKPVTHIETVEGTDEFEGVEFGVRVMSAGLREEYELSMFEFEDKPDGGMRTVPIRKDSKLKLIIKTICDPETGEPLFDESDMEQLRQYSGNAIQTLFDAASRVNGLGRKEEASDEEKN